MSIVTSLWPQKCNQALIAPVNSSAMQAHREYNQAVDRWRQQGDVRHALDRHGIRPRQRQRGGVIEQQLCHALHDFALCWREEVRRHGPHVLPHSSQQRRQQLLWQGIRCEAFRSLHCAGTMPRQQGGCTDKTGYSQRDSYGRQEQC